MSVFKFKKFGKLLIIGVKRIKIKIEESNLSNGQKFINKVKLEYCTTQTRKNWILQKEYLRPEKKIYNKN